MRHFIVVITLAAFLAVAICGSSAAQQPVVVELAAEGNKEIASQYILGVIGTKVGDPLNREQIDKDIEAIYNLGFFSYVDVRLETRPDGVKVVYVVQENPPVKEIRFEGNSIYSDEELMKEVFTVPGSIFNRVFFRHDLERIQNKYREAGYVLVRMQDVRFENGIVKVQIVEPRVGEIIIQGNTRTQTNVIRREIPIKEGDVFNATYMRHSLNKLQRLGYFEDVNVGFEPTDDPEVMNIVITVTEQRTGRIGVSIGHGSSSGWSGGLVYEDTNWQGKGHRAVVGFETGDREQYWISYEEPFMDEEYYAWKVGVYKHQWEDIDYIDDDGDTVFEYDEDRTGYYIGAGRKFKHDPRMNWYVTLDWHDSSVDPSRWYIEEPEDNEVVRNLLSSGKTFSILGTVQRTNTDRYLSYPKGDVEIFNIQQAMDIMGSDWDFTKYWIEGRYYTPLTFLQNIFGTELGTEDNPAILAARVRAGFSSGTLPWADQYFLGGDRDLRGYEEDQFEGSEMFLANVELRIPIQEAVGFVIFYDTGNAWGGVEWDSKTKALRKDTSGFDFSDLHDAMGFGVRVRTPLGNIRLDVAEGDYETFTHFGFGELF